MFCKECGKIIDDNSKFCKYCGGNVDDENTITEQSKSNYANNPECDATDNMQGLDQIESPSFDSGKTEDVEYPTFIQSDSYNQNNFYDKKQGISKSVAVVITILSTLLVVAVVFLCWNFLIKDDDTVESVPVSSASDEAVAGVSDETIYFEQASYNVGDYITFGSYEQDGDTSNGKEDIEWQVLDVSEDKIFVVSRYGLDIKPYNSVNEDITWEECTLRAWLNDYFLNYAFDEFEKNLIQTSNVETPCNDNYFTYGGNDTQDKMFLLSVDEVEKYFKKVSDMQCKPTRYARNKGAYINGDNGNGWWLLRTPGSEQNIACGVTSFGYIMEDGETVQIDVRIIRPAMWITIE